MGTHGSAVFDARDSSSDARHRVSIRVALEQAREMLTWGDDWDGEGSPGFSDDTWRRAHDLLVQAAQAFAQRRENEAPTPKLLPGPDGSTDIHWQQDDRELLVNVPADSHEAATDYGDTKAGATTKGSLDLSASNEWLLVWLKQ